MNFYIEITLISSPDFSPYELWSRIYTQLHLALVGTKAKVAKSEIGVSFPEYHFNSDKKIGFLGTKLRLFANQQELLEKLNLKAKLERLADYVHITSIQPVQQTKVTGYVSFCRKQIKSNAERLARRRVNKVGDISFEEAIQRYQNGIKTTDLPYIQLNSLSSAQPFKLFIEKRQGEKSSDFEFSSYGLSSKSTVPEF